MAHQVFVATADGAHDVALRDALYALDIGVLADLPSDMRDVVAVAVCLQGDPEARARSLVASGATRIVLFVPGTAKVAEQCVSGATCLPWTTAVEAADALVRWLDAAEPVEADAEEVVPIESDAEMVDEAELLDDAQGASATRAAPPPARVAATSGVEYVSIAREDQAFITRVFNQVRDVDFREPPPPPPKRDLAGLDKKMHFLRQRVRELERDLARVGYIWDTKSREVDSVDRIIAAKEAERATAVERYESIKQQATRAAAAHHAEEAVSQQRCDALNQEIVDLKSQLAQERQRAQDDVSALQQRVEQHQQETLRLAADFRGKLEMAQSAFNDLRERSSQRIAELEAIVRQREEKIAAQETERRSLEERIEAKSRELETLAADRDRTVATLTDELGQVRADRQERVGELKEQLQAIQAELVSARKEYEHIGTEVTAARERAEAELNQAKERIRELEAAATPPPKADPVVESSSPA